MSEPTAEQLAQRAFDLNLLDERNLRDIHIEFGDREASVEELKQFLLRRNVLTPYQIERLIRGEKGGYYYGSNKILYQIGSGTFARVYRAINQEKGLTVAIKVLRTRFSADAEKVESFRKEGEVGCALRHPNIVAIYEVASAGASHYMSMDFIEGQNLREFLKIRKKLDPAQATRLAADIARGLDYAFQRGISHRDLKTSNVLISSVGQAKLVDFGLAGADPDLSDDALANIENPRTIDYAALERATNVRKDDGRSDIYFLGCIYYNMLAGIPPLQETRDRVQRLSRTRFTSIVPINDVVPELPAVIAKVVNKAMALDPAGRYQTPAEFLADLNAISQRLSQGMPSGISKNSDVETVVEVSTGPTFKQRTLMVVESSTQLQDTLRELFKKSGFRVLVTSDAQRPANSFYEQVTPADCVVFSTTGLGAQAVEAFNRFGESAATQGVPAILLLGARHLPWAAKAKTDKHRVTVTTPIKVRELRALLDELMPLEEIRASVET
ncbi:MAG: serine/threonine-protein kinase [Planctomycetota bacterium]|nr:serine/threonine-protein kinase [Planctomycetota bacterium]